MNLEARFPGQVTDEIRNVINQQNDPALLKSWFEATLRGLTLADFVRVLRHGQ